MSETTPKPSPTRLVRDGIACRCGARMTMRSPTTGETLDLLESMMAFARAHSACPASTRSNGKVTK